MTKDNIMIDTDIHSCGYYCDRPLCIKAQRDELRDKLFSNQAVKTYSGGKPNYTQPIEQEPVAYITKRKSGGTEGLLRADMVDRSVKNQETHDFIPLYKDPTPCQTCVALARTVMMDQTSHDTKKEWVGLTDDEKEAIYKKADLENWHDQPLLKAVEEKLKEKNSTSEKNIQTSDTTKEKDE